jgi:mannosyltransferase OCH1-like enzyme
MKKISRKQFVILIILVIIVALRMFSISYNINIKKELFEITQEYLNDDIIDFENFNNSITLPKNSKLIVPNIVHLIYNDYTFIKFTDMINIFSIHFNQRPDRIYLHCDNCSFYGKYWNQVNEKLEHVIYIHQIPKHKTIYHQKIGWIQHRGDFWRILILMHYGGIYLDNDLFVVNSLDEYRCYEMALGRESNGKDIIGSQVLIAHKNARFLRAWLEGYRTNYNSKIW